MCCDGWGPKRFLLRVPDGLAPVQSSSTVSSTWVFGIECPPDRELEAIALDGEPGLFCSFCPHMQAQGRTGCMGSSAGHCYSKDSDLACTAHMCTYSRYLVGEIIHPVLCWSG